MGETGSISLECPIFVNILADFAKAVGVSAAFLVVTLLYLGLEIYAFRHVQKTRRK